MESKKRLPPAALHFLRTHERYLLIGADEDTLDGWSCRLPPDSRAVILYEQGEQIQLYAVGHASNGSIARTLLSVLADMTERRKRHAGQTD